MIAALVALALAAPDGGAPPAIPGLVQTLRQCRREERRGRADEESLSAASMLVAIIDERPSAPEVRALAPDLARGLDCGDAAVRRLCARGLGRLGALGAPEAASLRRRLASDRRPDGRALAAAVLAATGSSDPGSVNALERALGDRAEPVRLASATALLKLNAPARARPALERLTRSRDPQIAAAAASALREGR